MKFGMNEQEVKSVVAFSDEVDSIIKERLVPKERRSIKIIFGKNGEPRKTLSGVGATEIRVNLFETITNDEFSRLKNELSIQFGNAWLIESLSTNKSPFCASAPLYSTGRAIEERRVVDLGVKNGERLYTTNKCDPSNAAIKFCMPALRYLGYEIIEAKVSDSSGNVVDILEKW